MSWRRRCRLFIRGRSCYLALKRWRAAIYMPLPFHLIFCWSFSIFFDAISVDLPRARALQSITLSAPFPDALFCLLPHRSSVVYLAARIHFVLLSLFSPLLASLLIRCSRSPLVAGPSPRFTIFTINFPLVFYLAVAVPFCRRKFWPYNTTSFTMCVKAIQCVVQCVFWLPPSRWCPILFPFSFLSVYPIRLPYRSFILQVIDGATEKTLSAPSEMQMTQSFPKKKKANSFFLCVLGNALDAGLFSRWPIFFLYPNEYTAVKRRIRSLPKWQPKTARV